MSHASPGMEEDPVEEQSSMDGEFARRDLLGLYANLGLSLLHADNGVGVTGSSHFT